MDLEFRLESPPLFILYYACANDLLEILPMTSCLIYEIPFFLFPFFGGRVVVVETGSQK